MVRGSAAASGSADAVRSAPASNVVPRLLQPATHGHWSSVPPAFAASQAGSAAGQASRGTSGAAEPLESGEADLIITGGTVLTMAGPNLENGAVVIRDGEILAVGDAADIAARYAARTRVDARGMAVMPGLVNAHTHAPMALFRGIADDRQLMDWLGNYIFPAEAGFVDAEFVRWGTRLAAAEMIASGTTTFADFYYFEEDIALEVQRVGLRAVLGVALIDFPAPDNKTWDEAVAYARAFVTRYADHPLITPALAPHAPYTVSAEHLKEVRSLATELGVSIFIHVSESQDDLRQVAEMTGGLTPGAFLDSLGFLGPDVVAIHGVWLTPDELSRFAEVGVGVVHSPESNMMLASGIAPVAEMRVVGLEVAIGTDGPAGSNNDMDMFGEMASAARLQKVSRLDPTALSARGVLEMATIGGARVLGLAHRTGSIEPGKRADVIVVDLHRPGIQPVFSVDSALVYAASGSDVYMTVVDGRILMQDGHFFTLEVDEVLAKALEYRDRIVATLGKH